MKLCLPVGELTLVCDLNRILHEVIFRTYWREYAGRILFGTGHALSRIDGERDRVTAEKAHYYGHKCTREVYVLQLFRCKGVVTCNEICANC